MLNATFEGKDEQRPKMDLGDRALMQQSMLLFAQSFRTLEDLKTCMIFNQTKTDFITSDATGVSPNRF